MRKRKDSRLSREFQKRSHKPRKGMSRSDISELSDTEVFLQIPIIAGTVIAGVVSYLLVHSIVLSSIIAFLGLVVLVSYFIIVTTRWKRRISYREYQESRIGR